MPEEVSRGLVTSILFYFNIRMSHMWYAVVHVIGSHFVLAVRTYLFVAVHVFAENAATQIWAIMDCTLTVLITTAAPCCRCQVAAAYSWLSCGLCLAVSPAAK